MTYAREEALDALACGALPRQGKWSDEDYLWLTDETNRLVEFTDGFVEALPMPTSTHQTVLAYLFDCFREHVKPRGKVLFAALRVRIRQGKFREPDLLVLQDRDDPRFQDRFWLGADLVVEVVSPKGRRRDFVQKPLDYAEAGIPEYWIVDPRDETITVLTLDGDAYTEHGVFEPGGTATSPFLQGLEIDVGAVFDA
ncbi:MAG: Uma2 family endonuclease [Gammaproteobacteria bacterium]|nr:Uma2 family endonuclease [Gammaproteobacteria bacterium]